VGTDGNTAALAVESIRRWWQLTGKDTYPDAAAMPCITVAVSRSVIALQHSVAYGSAVAPT